MAPLAEMIVDEVRRQLAAFEVFAGDHVAQDVFDQIGVLHGGAAGLDDDGATAKLLEIGQRFEERVGFGASHGKGKISGGRRQPHL